MFRTRTFRPRMFRPRTFRTGLFSGVDVSDIFFSHFFVRSLFLYSGFYFHKRKKGKNIYCTPFLSTFITRVKHLLYIIFVNIYHFK